MMGSCASWRMGLRSLVFRAVLLLLVIRVFGAPMALRPRSYTDHPGGGLVFRVCNWPDQHRTSPSEVVPFGPEAVAWFPASLLSCHDSGSHGLPHPHFHPPTSPLASYLHRSLGSLRC